MIERTETNFCLCCYVSLLFLLFVVRGVVWYTFAFILGMAYSVDLIRIEELTKEPLVF